MATRPMQRPETAVWDAPCDLCGEPATWQKTNLAGAQSSCECVHCDRTWTVAEQVQRAINRRAS